MKKEMKDLKKKRKIDETTNNSEGELRLLMQPLAKPVLIDLLTKLGSKDPSIAAEIETIAYADHVHRKLFVRDLSLNTTSQTLCNAFKVYGEIEDGNVIVSEDTQKSRGYGYILYKDVKSAQKALSVPSKLIDGRSTLCMLARDEGKTKTSDTSLRKLYIGNLLPEVTDGMLHDYFGSLGDIDECSVVYKKDSYVSRGYGFVTYKTVKAAKEAIADLHRMTFNGRNIIVKYATNPREGGGGQSSAPPKAALPVPPRYVEGYPREGGGGQSSVPPTAALPVPPGYTYPQTAAPPYPYPQTYAPYAASHYPSLRPGPSTSQTHGYGQGPYPPHYYQNQ